MKLKALTFKESGLTKPEWNALKKLKTPEKIQDYLNSLPFNFEKRGETHRSVKESLKAKEIHCFEGALVAAAALWIQGRKPLILDLCAIRPDFDHVVTLFEKDGHWGAISKTNHSVLRYRDPIYRSVRELVMSYFHEYFLDDGTKSLRKYSKPYDLSKLGTYWIHTDENLVPLAYKLDRSAHEDILNKKQIKGLRKAEEIEVEATAETEWSPGKIRLNFK